MVQNRLKSAFLAHFWDIFCPFFAQITILFLNFLIYFCSKWNKMENKNCELVRGVRDLENYSNKICFPTFFIFLFKMDNKLKQTNCELVRGARLRQFFKKEMLFLIYFFCSKWKKMDIKKLWGGYGNGFKKGKNSYF